MAVCVRGCVTCSLLCLSVCVFVCLFVDPVHVQQAKDWTADKPPECRVVQAQDPVHPSVNFQWSSGQQEGACACVCAYVYCIEYNISHCNTSLHIPSCRHCLHFPAELVIRSIITVSNASWENSSCPSRRVLLTSPSVMLWLPPGCQVLLKYLRTKKCARIGSHGSLKWSPAL